MFGRLDAYLLYIYFNLRLLLGILLVRIKVSLIKCIFFVRFYVISFNVRFRHAFLGFSYQSSYHSNVNTGI